MEYHQKLEDHFSGFLFTLFLRGSPNYTFIGFLPFRIEVAEETDSTLVQKVIGSSEWHFDEETLD
jgi:hypothetical protein